MKKLWMTTAAVLLCTAAHADMLFTIPPSVSEGHLNVRSGPGVNHGLIGAIPGGQTVSASRCVPRDDGIRGAEWCFVSWNGLRGWASQAGLMPVQQQAPVQQPTAYNSDADVVCGRPQVLFDLDRDPGTNPVVSVEVSYFPKDHAWRIFHHLANGAVVSRSEQYAITDMTDDHKTQWAGSLNRNRSKYMVGEVKFNQQHEPFYYEWVYDKSHGNRLEMNSVAKCAWNDQQQQLPAPTSQAAPQPSAPVVAQDDKPVKTVPYKADLSSAEDSIPIYPGHEGNAAMVDVIVGGQPVRMLLDTGATMMQISTDLANRIVQQHQGSWGKAVKMSLADGSVVNQPTINIEEVRIGSHIIHNIPSAYTDGGDMIMAFPVVDSIAPFKIDTRNRKLVFEKQEASR